MKIIITFKSSDRVVLEESQIVEISNVIGDMLVDEFPELFDPNFVARDKDYDLPNKEFNLLPAQYDIETVVEGVK